MSRCSVVLLKLECLKKIKPANKLTVFVAQSIYFLDFFFLKLLSWLFNIAFWDMRSPYKAILIHLSLSSASVQSLAVTSSFCRLILLKSHWSEFKACEVLVSNVCMQKRFNFMKKWFLAMAFLAVCFPIAFRASLLMGVQVQLRVWKSCCSLLLLMGLSPTYPLLLGFIQFSDS